MADCAIAFAAGAEFATALILIIRGPFVFAFQAKAMVREARKEAYQIGVLTVAAAEAIDEKRRANADP